ncbi:uncharacterized protein LOC120698452 isoform X1 [Panicum virgatum]|uniref:uncharacterized protein LOC120698452 isoform X1 n=1 Tax=Panicum virgatum TaxID=38727 RepID=UPI0019D65FBA|nr:uncharacterized protein LOC120698452 isoform X1 [Panicum virgatum]
METPRFLSDIFPQDQADLSWIPNGMDVNSSYRLAMNMFMILTHHHLLLQSQRERESRKKSLTTDLHPQFATPPRPITSIQTTSPMTRRLLEVEPFTPTRAISYVQTPSPVTRSRKRVLELEGYIEPVACLALSPVAGTPKGRVKKLKVVRSKMN